MLLEIWQVILHWIGMCLRSVVISDMLSCFYQYLLLCILMFFVLVHDGRNSLFLVYLCISTVCLGVGVLYRVRWSDNELKNKLVLLSKELNWTSLVFIDLYDPPTTLCHFLQQYGFIVEKKRRLRFLIDYNWLNGVKIKEIQNFKV